MSTSDPQRAKDTSRLATVMRGATLALAVAACGSTGGLTVPAPAPEDAGPWMRALASEDSTQRHAAARSLWLQASSARLPAESLMTLLNSDTGAVRLYVGLTLLRSQYAQPRWAAVEALGLHRPAHASGLQWRAAEERETFLAALDDPDPEVRYQAALALRLIGIDDSAAVDRLLTVLDDPEPKVAGQAARTLMAAGPLLSERVPALVALLHRRGLTGRLAANVLAAVGPSAEPAIPTLVAYAKYGDPTSRPRSPGAMRLAAVRALIGINVAARPYLDSLRHHPDPVLRTVAQQALEAMASNSSPHGFYPRADGWVADTYEADMKTDLGNLVWAQARYRAKYHEFAADIPALTLDITVGVTLMTAGGSEGWQATTSHQGTSTRCMIFVGRIPAPVPGLRPNAPTCSP